MVFLDTTGRADVGPPSPVSDPAVQPLPIQTVWEDLRRESILAIPERIRKGGTRVLQGRKKGGNGWVGNGNATGRLKRLKGKPGGSYSTGTRETASCRKNSGPQRKWRIRLRARTVLNVADRKTHPGKVQGKKGERPWPTSEDAYACRSVPHARPTIRGPTTNQRRRTMKTTDYSQGRVGDICTKRASSELQPRFPSKHPPPIFPVRMPRHEVGCSFGGPEGWEPHGLKQFVVRNLLSSERCLLVLPRLSQQHPHVFLDG